jgi:hypothetical protein
VSWKSLQSICGGVKILSSLGHPNFVFQCSSENKLPRLHGSAFKFCWGLMVPKNCLVMPTPILGQDEVDFRLSWAVTNIGNEIPKSYNNDVIFEFICKFTSSDHIKV